MDKVHVKHAALGLFEELEKPLNTTTKCMNMPAKCVRVDQVGQMEQSLCLSLSKSQKVLGRLLHSREAMYESLMPSTVDFFFLITDTKLLLVIEVGMKDCSQLNSLSVIKELSH